MWNLFKSVIRSFKRNKATIVGLSLLTFVSVTVFTCANSTTSGINQEYNQISSEGNLHDFTVSELYNTGICKWSNDTKEQTDDRDPDHPVSYYTPLYNNDHLVMSSDSTLEPYVDASTTDSGYSFTVYYTINLDLIDHQSTLYDFYLNALTNPSVMDEYEEYLAPTVTIEQASSSETDDLYNYITNTQQSYGKQQETITQKTSSEIEGYLQYLDNNAINEQLTADSSTLLDILSTHDTLMDQFLTNPDKGVGNYVTYRNFSSINIDNAGDNFFYKAVTSNPEDQIDKMVLIDSDSTKNGTQWNNFGVSDCTYDVLDSSADEGYDLGKTLKYLPSSISQDSYDIHFIEKIYLLAHCDWGSTASTSTIYNTYVKPLTINKCPKTQQERSAYWTNNFSLINELLAYEHNNHEQVYVKTNSVSLQWVDSFGAPSVAVISNWTSFFGIVNPEYMQKHGLTTMNESMYDSEPSYQDYVKVHPDITDQKQRLLGWLNSLNYPDLHLWFQKTVANTNFQKQIINPGSGTPYIIVGSGITPDFIYPIVSISRSTPNPDKECIMFLNQAGYTRIYDSYRSDETENYLVGQFKNNLSSSKKQEVLNQINAYAASVMLYPAGTNAAYMADDTTDTLNAAAFRVAYIPHFVHDVNLVSLFLTVFILVLTIIISIIVIHRYIVNNQSTYGIMQANGFSWWKIATSIIPFGFLPAFIGTLSGVLIGLALQIPLLHKFSAFWMLPTATIGFNLWMFLIFLLIITALFTIVIYATAYHILHKKTVDVMKANSQENPNLVAKAAKASFKNTGILVRYRIAVAFNSLWKLLVLVVMTALTLSSLVFSISIHDKFENAVAATNASRNYTYAIQLNTPTEAGGQYKPIQFDENSHGVFAGSGLTGFYTAGNDSRDTNYYQSLYFGQTQEVTWDLPIIGEVTFNLPGISYNGIIPNAYSVPLADFNKDGSQLYLQNTRIVQDDPTAYQSYTISDCINHNYYYSTYAMDYANDPLESIQDHVDNYKDALTYTDKDGNVNYLTNVYYPYMGDTVGEQLDMFYLKNRVATNSTLNHTVGVSFMGILTNPWDISTSMEPDSIINQATAHSANFINYLGKAVYDDGEDDPDPNINELHAILQNRSFASEYQNYIQKNDDGSYSINPSYATHSFLSISLVPGLMELLNTGYAYTPAALNDFYMMWDGVPLKNDDETYTYLDANVLRSGNSKVQILGVKATPGYTTKFVNLVDDQGDDLINKIRFTYHDIQAKNPYPIVVNAYAAHKYGLTIGSTISFQINNRADRYEHEMKVNNHIDDTQEYQKLTNQTFKVVGICNTYEGEEYFIDQDLANYLLGLKSHLLDSELLLQHQSQPRDYYGFEDATLGADGYAGFDITGDGFEDTEAGLLDLGQFDANSSNSEWNLTPYGFNGVFTSHVDDNPILSDNLSLYAPTGLYLSNDLLNSNRALEVLQYGANVKMASDMLLKDRNGKPLSDLANQIDDAYEIWQNDMTEANHQALANYASDLLAQVIAVYSNQDYETIIKGASDKNVLALTYSNMSNMVDTLTNISIATIIIMTTLIVVLMTSMTINDSKKLAGLLKAMGYTDKENAMTYLAIYVPVIAFGLLFAALLTWGLIASYNSIIFNGIGIWLNARISWYFYLYGLIVVGAMFAIAGAAGVFTLKRERLIDLIKNN